MQSRLTGNNSRRPGNGSRRYVENGSSSTNPSIGGRNLGQRRNFEFGSSSSNPNPRGSVHNRLNFANPPQHLPRSNALNGVRRSLPVAASATLPNSFKRSLHLPPNPNNPDYIGCCLRCMSFEHETWRCRGPSRCAKCYRIGHKYKGCHEPIDHTFPDVPVDAMRIRGKEADDTIH